MASFGSQRPHTEGIVTWVYHGKGGIHVLPPTESKNVMLSRCAVLSKALQCPWLRTDSALLLTCHRDPLMDRTTALARGPFAACVVVHTTYDLGDASVISCK
jgi:hypothetical protein